MNHCESYEPLLDAFAEGDLFLEDMIRVQQHLNNCPECQAYLEDLLAIRAAFPTVEETEVPDGFTASVMAAVTATPQAASPGNVSSHNSNRPNKKPTTWLKILSGLAACCAIVLLAQGGLHMAAGGTAANESTAAADTAPEVALYTMQDRGETETPAAGKSSNQQLSELPSENSAAEYSEDSMPPQTAEPDTTAYRMIVRVNADLLAGLLDACSPVAEYQETASNGAAVLIREYELSLAAYETLLDQMAALGEAPEQEILSLDSETVLVIVQQ